MKKTSKTTNGNLHKDRYQRSLDMMDNHVYNTLKGVNMINKQAQAIATVFGGLEIKIDDINRRLDDVKKTMEHQNALNQKEHEKDRALNQKERETDRALNQKEHEKTRALSETDRALNQKEHEKTRALSETDRALNQKEHEKTRALSETDRALNQKEHEKDRAINKNYMRIVVGLLGALTIAAFRGWLGF